jgi:hypothetical protein
VRTNVAARVLLGLGLIAAWVGYDAWIVSHVVLDPNATRSAAHAVLQTEPVRRGLTDALTQELVHRIPAAAKDPNVRPAVAQALRDPRVTAAFADTMARLHEGILTGGSGTTFRIDGRPVTAALHDALVSRDPRLAAQIRQVSPLSIPIRTAGAPIVHDPRPLAEGLTILGIMAALLLVTASLLRKHDRRSFARVGRRIAFLSVFPLAVFLVLPHVLAHLSGTTPQVASVLLRTYGHRVLPSAFGLLIAGLLVALGALVWPRPVDATAAAPDVTPYSGPPPKPRPAGAPENATITEKLYL